MDNKFTRIFQLFIRWVLSFFRKKEPPPKLQWSPFVKYPVNEPCYCGSGLKYKKCHRSSEEMIIPEEIAVKAAGLVKKVRAQRANDKA